MQSIFEACEKCGKPKRMKVIITTPWAHSEYMDCGSCTTKAVNKWAETAYKILGLLRA